MTRVGPAGWAYKDWLGIVYPPKKPKGFNELAFLAEFFDTVEINVSFYRPLTPAMAEGWVAKVERNLRFRFTAKLWRGFTHECDATVDDEREFKDGIAPLFEANRLGALLLQFPWSFRNTDENRSYIAQLQSRFRDYPLVLEVRHASWSEQGILDSLEQMGIGLCNIDQPLFKRSIKPSGLATSPVGYIRLHGRNYKAWFAENKHVGERYDYLYSVEELEPWVDRIKAVEHNTEETYVVTNNHYLGKAIVNAVEISSILQGEPVSAPSGIAERYPEAKPFIRAAPGEQMPLI